MPLLQSIQPQVSGDQRTQKFAADVAKWMDTRRVGMRITTGAEVAGVRTITLQVIDRLSREPISGRWLVRWWIATTEWGQPGGDQDVAITTGTLVENTNDQIIEAATDDGGTLVFTLEIGAVGSRYVYIANLEELGSTGQMVSAGGGTVSAGGGSFAPDDAVYLLNSSDPDLPNGLVLTAGSNITLTPGAGTLTVASTASGGTTVQSGTATVDFGSPHEDGTATVTVTGQAWVTADSIITATAPAVASADHDAIDAALEGLTCHVGNIVAGTGFDITVSARNGTWGRFTIHWTGIDP